MPREILLKFIGEKLTKKNSNYIAFSQFFYQRDCCITFKIKIYGCHPLTTSFKAVGIHVLRTILKSRVPWPYFLSWGSACACPVNGPYNFYLLLLSKDSQVVTIKVYRSNTYKNIYDGQMFRQRPLWIYLVDLLCLSVHTLFMFYQPKEAYPSIQSISKVK